MHKRRQTQMQSISRKDYSLRSPPSIFKMQAIQKHNTQSRVQTPESQNWNGGHRKFIETKANLNEWNALPLKNYDDDEDNSNEEHVAQSIKAFRTEQGNRIEILENQVLQAANHVENYSGLFCGNKSTDLPESDMNEVDQDLEEGACGGDSDASDASDDEDDEMADEIMEVTQHRYLYRQQMIENINCAHRKKFAQDRQKYDAYPRISERNPNRVEIGPNGSDISLDSYNTMDWRNIPESTVALMAQLFDPTVLATHSLGGIRFPDVYGNLGPPEYQLNQSIVSDIVHCLRVNSFADIRNVFDLIKMECEDMAKSCNEQHINKKARIE